MNLQKFLLHFPTPQYLDVPYAALVFSENSLRVLTIDNKNSHPDFVTEVQLSSGVIQAGKVVNNAELVKIINDIKTKIKSRFVKFAIPEEAVYVFTAKVPVVESKDLRESISFILEENVPLPLAEISFGYEVEGLESNQSGFVAKASVVAVSTDVVESYVGTLKEAGLVPLACINESQAVTNALVSLRQTGITAIVQIHKKTAGIYLASNDVVEFSSTVPLPDNTPEALNAIKLECDRAIDYWSNHKQSHSQSEYLRCIVCGEYELAQKAIEQISSIGSNVHAELGNVWQNLFSLEEYIPDISFEDSLKYAAAVGLLIRK